METLWSISTTVREAERIVGFLKTAVELDGQVWNKASQIKFQVLLIKNRQYLNVSDNAQTFNKLNSRQSALLKDKSVDMTYEQALDIFNAKDYEDPPMRGRQSMAPLQKLGLVYVVDKDEQKIVQVTEVGKKLAADKIEFSDFMLDSLLKFQYPNPYEGGFKNWNTKPFINTLRLVKRVNELCEQSGRKAKGVSTLEFGVFALSLRSYLLVDSTAAQVLKFRESYESYHDDAERDIFVENYIRSYLSDFQNPVKNVREYTDNMVRYLRLTKYIYIRGKYSNTYVDLEPRRMTEIESILEHDSGAAEVYSKEAWVAYMGTYGTYKLPFETAPVLASILSEVNREIAELETTLGIPQTQTSTPSTPKALKSVIEGRRTYRTRLQNLMLKESYYNDVSKIDEAVEALNDILQRNKPKLVKKFSIELEKWTNIALNIINDALFIKPNSPVGDDNEPIYTAPSGVPDIECYYESFGAVAEVTMLTSRDQWYNEGQPVMRHLRDFEISNSEKPNYCLFVAPKLHVDTVNTFYHSVKYEYEGKKQKIVPITISQLIRLLKLVKNMVAAGKQFSHKELMKFYDECTDLSSLGSSVDWQRLIEERLRIMETQLVA
ncbi:MAG: AlwI family type II restriction endonuclease [Thermoguttaceae bacterium]|nr:AlwI family type II restriction endonuclease [Thermoguttaceae bacterium]